MSMSCIDREASEELAGQRLNETIGQRGSWAARLKFLSSSSSMSPVPVSPLFGCAFKFTFTFASPRCGRGADKGNHMWYRLQPHLWATCSHCRRTSPSGRLLCMWALALDEGDATHATTAENLRTITASVPTDSGTGSRLVRDGNCASSPMIRMEAWTSSAFRSLTWRTSFSRSTIGAFSSEDKNHPAVSPAAFPMFIGSRR
mmetsp:Transcript_100295/g.282950  ORF Transcript_100295/g.282950 Transcript_100295/m.282950 type:complete len:202 (+) Transcript_100295:970-1575(+)